MVCIFVLPCLNAGLLSVYYDWIYNFSNFILHISRFQFSLSRWHLSFFLRLSLLSHRLSGKMNNLSDNQGDESAYQEANYYGTIDSSLGDPEGDYSTGDMEQRSPLREQDRFLPIANVSKIMKKAIPPQGKVAKDAKECVQECVSEFISFITSEAAERCQNEKRKTINGEDLLWAMSTLGFENYVDPLKTFLIKYRDVSLSFIFLSLFKWLFAYLCMFRVSHL